MLNKQRSIIRMVALRAGFKKMQYAFMNIVSSQAPEFNKDLDN